ncbi:hypothetical protein ES707_03642 [subsurface metagenome]
MATLAELSQIGKGVSGAYFSSFREYRYALWRIWDRETPAVIFIGLNPSTASHIKDDPTIRRMVGFAKSWGFGGLYVGNLYALVSSNPGEVLARKEESIGTDNDVVLENLTRVAGITIVGWGNNAQYSNRYKEVLAMLRKPVYCLGITKAGQPKHPLYLPYMIEPRVFKI